ncbi:MAG: hypothetical protein HYX46_06255 [Betaproteobacteria bacterium]|nr:hypothetical protein [Betaproteobacteria bacterium]
MQAEHPGQTAFYLTGKQPGDEPIPVEGLGLRPALLAAYRDLTRLRYDFPVVLVRDAPDGAIVESLSRLVDRLLEEAAASGNEGEQVRVHALNLEQEVRAMAAGGVAGSLTALLDEAARHLASDQDAAFAGSLKSLSAALKVDGEVLDCNAVMPTRLVTHAWRAVQRRKAESFRKDVDRLMLKLGDILRADFAASEAGRAPASLKASFGTIHADAFDFEAMSRLLGGISGKRPLSEKRRRRIEATLEALRTQRFYAGPDSGSETFAFRFEDCASALAAFRDRHAEIVRLARAIAIAELEIGGEFSEPRHDALFEQLGESGLDLHDLALFPDYLVCLNARDLPALEYGELIEILGGRLPVKLLVQTDDMLEEPLAGTGHLAFGARSRQLASMAIGLNEVYVLQTSSSNLVRCREQVLKAMSYPGPALILVYSGAGGTADGLPPYLAAAAAMESRAFPAFTYDPSAGPDWASRFTLDQNPQADRDWPQHPLSYEDPEHQRVSAELAFTLVDFVACDRRYAKHFAKVPRAEWNGNLAPVGECLAREPRRLPEKLPSLLMVDGENVLHRVIVDERLIREARRCRDMWRSLQELGGIHNSHAEKLLAREREAWEKARQSEVRAPEAAATAPPATAAVSAAAPAPAPAVEAEPERRSDEPYIETPRCSSCDECIQINDKMFAYDGNKQARIVDPNAGTYRQLVEAAESCQVAVIHPGKPKNPNEPGLDELLKRAEAFL